MPLSRFVPVILAALLLAGGFLRAEHLKPPPQARAAIDQVRIGFPGTEAGQRRVRLGAWVPVGVDLVAETRSPQGSLELILEWAEGDARAQVIVAVPELKAGEQRTVLASYRPGDRSAELALTLRRSGGEVLGKSTQRPPFDSILDPEEILYLVVGTPPAGLREALVPKKRGEEDDQRAQLIADRRLAIPSHISELPTQWIGYQGVDVVVLSSLTPDQLRTLNQSSQGVALGEWLRRGGRLVLGLGKDLQEYQRLLEELGLREVKLVRSENVAQLKEVADWTRLPADSFPGQPMIETIRLELGQGGLPLAEDRQGPRSWPVLSMVPVGRGRVLLVAFDPGTLKDRKAASALWQTVHGEMAPRLASASRGDAALAGQRSNELASALQRGLEQFDGVSSLSFGWVALLILAYILIIGPLDYWFLKKVVKRLEWTWVTFPIVVLVVSVIALLASQRSRGDHLHVNKVDVVDIHLGEDRVLGTTWFSLYSPRVQAFTLDLEALPAWGGEPAGTRTVLTPLIAPDSSLGGVDRPASQTVFRKPYQQADPMSGLKEVPIPAGASRSFTGSWRSSIEPGKLVRLEGLGLSREGMQQRLIGRIVNELPVELTEVSLFYNGQWHPLGELPRGPYRIPREVPLQANRNINQWMLQPFQTVLSPAAAEATSTREEARNLPAESERGRMRASALMKGVLFYGQDSHAPWTDERNNSGLRLVDQGWRLRGVPVAGRSDRAYLDEAILVGRAVLPPAAAESVLERGIAPTRLWLGELAGGQTQRKPLTGFLAQDTYVRIYIPVPRTPSDRQGDRPQGQP